MGTEGTSCGIKAARSILCLLLLLGVACSERIKPGHSGILEESDSGHKSADEIELLHGKVYYNPFTEDVHTFSHAMHRVKWNFDDDDAAKSKEITFSSYGGAVVKSAVEIGYTYKPGRIPHVFVALRNTKGMVIEDFMWRSTHEAIGECAVTLPVEAIYGSQKTEITRCALDKLRQEPFIRNNFELAYLNFVGRFRFAAAVRDAINLKVTTRIEMEASEREGAARRKAAILNAKNQREVARIEAEGLAVLDGSLSKNLLEYKRLLEYERLQGEPMSLTCEGQ